MIPKISVIMPTHDRRQFIPQALKYFSWQDYSNKELIIVDDGDDLVADLIPNDSSIRYMSLSIPLSIGMKRNIACSLASGDIISFQDDDDWYSPHRLSQQAQPILQGEVALTAFHMSLLLQASTGTLVACPEPIHDRLFPLGVRAGTLMYPRHLWDSARRAYGDVNTGEDAAFLRQLLDLYALHPIVDPSAYICVRHGGNVTRDLDISGWKQVPLGQYLSVDEQAFYRQFQAVPV